MLATERWTTHPGPPGPPLWARRALFVAAAVAAGSVWSVATFIAFHEQVRREILAARGSARLWYDPSPCTRDFIPSALTVVAYAVIAYAACECWRGRARNGGALARERRFRGVAALSVGCFLLCLDFSHGMFVAFNTIRCSHGGPGPLEAVVRGWWSALPGAVLVGGVVIVLAGRLRSCLRRSGWLAHLVIIAVADIGVHVVAFVRAMYF